MANKPKVVVGESSNVTASQMSDFWRQVADGSLDGNQIQALLEHRNPFDNKAVIIHQKHKFSKGIQSLVDKWESYYQLRFNITLNLSDLKIPKKQEGVSHLLIIAQGLTPNRVVEAARPHYGFLLYRNDLDSIIIHNDRTPHKTYAIWVKNRVEADEELANKSVEDLKASGTTTETLLERLTHGDECHLRLGHHLDQGNTTLCAGSCDSFGYVPCVLWDKDDGLVHVCAYFSSKTWGDPRARLVVA